MIVTSMVPTSRTWRSMLISCVVPRMLLLHGFGSTRAKVPLSAAEVLAVEAMTWLNETLELSSTVSVVPL
jgi:hypothetical protein